MSYADEAQVRAIMNERLSAARETRRGRVDRRAPQAPLSGVARRVLARVRPMLAN